MPAYNFYEPFATFVEKGAKKTTIRPRRKRVTQVSDDLYLYVGQRTKRCRLLRKAICRSVKPIDIYPSYIVLNGRQLPVEEAWDLARRDGFRTLEDFYDFFQACYSLPVVGELELIEWS